MTKEEIALDARRSILRRIYEAQTSHIGSNFSCIELMTALFERFDFSRDKFILSAGWKAATLYYFLWRNGKITDEEWLSYCKPGSKFIGLCEPVVPEIIFAGGSMGMGLSAAVALAWSKKQRGQPGRVYVLESDGGMQVGINLEAQRFAVQHKLDNLVLIVDRNGFQAMGKTDDIISMEQLRDELAASGWRTVEINGHAFESIEFALNIEAEKKPLAIIADTVKGRGVSFMEQENIFHYKAPSEDEFNRAMIELCPK